MGHPDRELRIALCLALVLLAAVIITVVVLGILYGVT
jgi:hypothetical protein